MGDLVPCIGVLDICDICDSSPHAVGCPRHVDYDDARVEYVRTDSPDDVGTASFWVEETFGAAALEAGESKESALREGVAEFREAVRRGELRRARYSSKNVRGSGI